jgi:phosphoribosyl 1,2-cyclic phosphate phosphodiesterase
LKIDQANLFELSNFLKDSIAENDRVDDGSVLEDFETEIILADIKINFFRQNHRDIDSLGIRIGNFVYSNDVVKYPKESEKYLENANILLIDCIDHISTDAHFGLNDVLILHEKFKPEETYLVNMSHNIDYFDIQKVLPSNIKPSYDGLIFRILE